MKVVIRVDASTQIGSGHVMRCLTLAHMLNTAGYQVLFACRIEQGHLIEYIKANGFAVLELGSQTLSKPIQQREDAQQTIKALQELNIKQAWVVVDHYALDQVWETEFVVSGYKLMVIDDLANRPHNCQILLDQNYYMDLNDRYYNLVPNDCKLLLGPKYLLLRPEFYQALQIRKEKKPLNSLKRLLIFFGGSDPTNETKKVLQAIKHTHLPQNLHIDVVVGSSNHNKEQIEDLTHSIGANFYCQIDFIAKLMAQADFSLGAGGVTMWERCYLGLPSAVTVVAENQIKATEAAASYGAVMNLGWHAGVSMESYQAAINKAINHPEWLLSLSHKSLELLESNNGEKDIILSHLK